MPRPGPPGAGDRLACLPPVARTDAEILVLGTMPGPTSLARGEYYAHPRNAFWPLLGELLGFAATAPYGDRLAALQAGHIALWDVLAACTRDGAADTAIVAAVANDFAAFFAVHRRIGLVCFNGGGAARLFHRLVPPAAAPAGMRFVQLPSTSPAYAAMGFADKLAGWRAGLAAAPAGGHPSGRPPTGLHEPV